jgi:hypothetical protein
MVEPDPYTLHVPDAVLADLAARLRATVWPDDSDNAGWRYGVNRDYLRRLVDWWRDEYDWRRAEADINALPNYRVDLDGVPVHFMHCRGAGPDPVPLVITHGWPWTFLDIRKVIETLADPVAHGGRPEDAFDVVVPSLPGHCLSGPPPRAGINFWRTADLWHTLMADILGHRHPRLVAARLCGRGAASMAAVARPHAAGGSADGDHLPRRRESAGVTTAERVALFQSGPRVAAFNTVYLNAHDTGGHFGYYENPEAVVHDLRAMFRTRRG